MAFHVACPITCRRICSCALGFPRPSASDFLNDVRKLEDFLTDPTRLHDVNGVVRVPVPKVVAAASQQQEVVVAEDEAAVFSHTKRVALQKKAAAAVVVAEDYARRFESGYLTVGASKDMAGEEQGQSNANVLCRMCFYGETEGSERARRMLSCKSCDKKYHRICVKNWARNRDLFHWSSWTCPSCRICEVCRRTGDPNKFMFCRRCDAAYHCYCQHPPHKNVSSGPYLCPKHTRCHSCGSNVPGNGLYVRWFLGYTCCDACGRLFVKGNYCPVCLKVYRDSESTPMVCCDVCQRWVHCQCDGISGERYQQFQEDGNLQYTCATCRGESYQVKDLEDAVQELWRRKDETDRDLIASLRAAAGLPTEEEIFSISPFSDDEDNGPVTYKSEFGRSLRFSLKGLTSKSPKASKENGKKVKSHKKYSKRKKLKASLIGNAEESGNFGRPHELQSSQDSLGYDKDDDAQLYGKEGLKTIASSNQVSASFNQGTHVENHPGVFKHRFVNEVMMSNEDRRTPTLKIKNTNHVSDVEATSEKHASKEKAGKMRRLVISLGSRKINVTTSANSDASSCQREQDSATFRGAGSEDESLQRTSNKFPADGHDSDAKSNYGDRVDHTGQVKGLKFAGRRNFIKIGKAKSEIGESNSTYGRGSDPEGYECPPQEHPRVSLRRRGSEASTTEFSLSDCLKSRGDKPPFGKQSDCRPDSYGESYEDYSQSPVSHSLPKESKPLLRLKFKKPQSEYPNSHSSHVEEVKNVYKNDEEEKSSVKGQRSKRKRPVFVERSFNEDEKEDNTVTHAENSMDANWILKKLGKDGVGKRVEVQQSSDSSWHKGVVTDIDDVSSTLYVTLDDGRLRTLQLGKQGVRFVTQNQKRSRT